jgi:hypothetical protein
MTASWRSEIDVADIVIAIGWNSEAYSTDQMTCQLRSPLDDVAAGALSQVKAFWS